MGKCYNCKYRSGDIEKPCDECVAGSRWEADTADDQEKKFCSTCAYKTLSTCDEPCNSCHKKSNYVPVSVDEQDMVNHPPHYEGRTSMECIDVMEIAFGTEAVAHFCLLNAFKYVWRHQHKNGLEDLEKAMWYLDRFDMMASEGCFDKGMVEAYGKLREMAETFAGGKK